MNFKVTNRMGASEGMDSLTDKDAEMIKEKFNVQLFTDSHFITIECREEDEMIALLTIGMTAVNKYLSLLEFFKPKKDIEIVTDTLQETFDRFDQELNNYLNRHT